MSSDLTDQITATLAEFSSATRLFELRLGDASCSTLLVEAFSAEDALLDIPVCDVIALSTNAYLKAEPLLGQPASLQITLVDGEQESIGGEICAVSVLGSDGGLARYRIRISPWIWRLEHVRSSRVWQDKTIVEIVDEVFASYRPVARWRWSADTASYMATVPSRSYCCQYRERDLDFVRRLLAEEGLGWRTEQTEDGPCLVLFADSTSLDAVPDDRSCRDGAGVRYHNASSVEEHDTVQALVEHKRLHASLTTLQSADYKAKQLVGAASLSVTKAKSLPELESYDAPGQYAFTDTASARRHADLQMQAAEARGQLWQGRSTVRTMRAGTRLTVTGMPLGRLGDAAAFTIHHVTSIGVNNMPPPAQLALAELFGPLPELLAEAVRARQDGLAQVIEQAQKTGYANCFAAIPAGVPWRPQLHQGEDRIKARTTAHGAQTAIVIGADGNDRPDKADDAYCDRLGRIRIRFHWQDSGHASCWVRVAQRLAGSGMGCQFLPRVGQEVLVQFLENDIDRPVVVGALYNGRGEGGIAPTPGGHTGAPDDRECFGRAHDHAYSAQANLAGGNSPAWHGASSDADGHRNRAAQWGLRTAGIGGSGYNQLLIDDSDGQGRAQLRTTQSATELNLGHLLHAADNYRGSSRGRGAELRSDRYGAARGGSGLLVSSWQLRHDAASRDVAGENATGASLIRQAAATAGTLHPAARIHQTVGLAAHAGSVKANASVLDGKCGPVKAMSNAVSAPQTESGAALVTVSAKDVFGASAGQSLQLANGETVTLVSVQDTQLAGGAGLRLHTGQVIGALAGATGSGAGSAGLQLIAAQDEIGLQAQADALAVQARDDVKLLSASAHIDWAAAQRIVLSTAGGASLTIDGGNISVQCPGKLAVHANKKSLTDPQQLGYPMPALPRSVCVECLKRALAVGSAFSMVE
ncbi:type VI secretion system Vgr family protein [Massilia sp. BHUDP2]|uniref:type VI secretion system Vgr family protein n=1 Tax=Massilia sp. BHUDP2 TaxID=3034505 RepID=UPI00390695C8